MTINFGNIVRIEKLIDSSSEILQMHCRDMSILSIGIPIVERRKKEIIKYILKQSSPSNLNKLFAYFQKPTLNCWELYIVEKEYKRMGINFDNQWRVTKMNHKFRVVENGASEYVVPFDINDEMVLRMSTFRAGGRFPHLVWGNNRSQFILRTSGLHSVADSLTGVSSIANSRDEVTLLRKTIQMAKTDHINFIFMEDKKVTVPENEDSSLVTHYYFLNLPSTVQLCDSFTKLSHVINKPFYKQPTRSSSTLSTYSDKESSNFVNPRTEFFEAVAQSKVLDNTYVFLLNACKIAKKLEEEPVCVLASVEGTGAVGTISSLVQLFLDSYYRTVVGFCILVEKEFLSFGHSFGNFTKKREIDAPSSIFLTFIDCVWQIQQQLPQFFEFNELYLEFIINSLYSCRYGTFLSPDERTKITSKISKICPSLWVDSINEKSFINLNYYQSSDVPLLPSFKCEKSHIKLWSFYLSQKNKLCISNAFGSIQRTFNINESPSELNLNSRELSNISPTLFNFPWKGIDNKIMAINLSNNYFVNVPGNFIQQFKNAEELDLSSNNIVFIPEFFFESINSKKFKILNLANNGLLDVSCLSKLVQNLMILNLHGNHLTEFPLEILNLPSLTDLDLGNNQLSNYFSKLHSSGWKFSSKNLKVLNLSLNGFDFLPNFCLDQLNSLDLSSNKLVSIEEPSLINLHQSLVKKNSFESLDISHNPLVKFPKIVFKLFSHLKRINLSSIGLNTIPPQIENLQQLASLNLSANILDHLPDEFYLLSSLKYLNLSNNQLTSLSLEISKLSKLVELNLENNKLFALTAGVGNLASLTYLNINNNYVKHIPGTIGYLEKLRYSAKFYFQQQNVKLLTPPLELVNNSHGEGGLDDIFNFLQSLLQGERKSARMKVMVVGQENVGKTTLIRCLKAYNRNKKLNKSSQAHLDKSLKSTGLESLSTDGIDVGCISYTKKNASKNNINDDNREDTVELNIWDFAGQEIYYTTHQFFLSERSVYIIVWNIAKAEEESRIEYWLNSIKSRAKSAPIIIVATHSDHPKATKEYIRNSLEAITEKYQKKEFKAIEKIVPVSCSNLSGIPELYRDILDVVESQECMGESIPNSYLELDKLIKEEASKRFPPIVSWDEFCSLTKICSIIQQESHIRTVCNLLHHYGSLVYYNEKGLSDMIILSPQWIMDLMSTIITTKHNIIKNGLLAHVNLPQLWRSPHFPEHLHQSFLVLLQKFEIIYYLKTSFTFSQGEIKPNNQLAEPSKSSIYEGYSLIPSLLPEDKPSHLIDKKWSIFPGPNEKQFSRVYKFHFIPSGFISRLLVRLLHFAEASVIWRYGMLIEPTTSANIFSGGTSELYSILVEAFPARKQITIAIRQPNCKSKGSSVIMKLSQLLIETINGLIGGWKGLTPKITIPCIHCVQLKMYDPFLFRIEDCEKAAISGMSTVTCRDVKSILLDQLAPDVAMIHIQNCKLNYSEMTFEKEIGEGGFATVYKGEYKGEVVAIKKMKFTGENSAENEEVLAAFSEFRREVWIMSGLKHLNTVQLIGFTMEPVICIITEFLSGGNLYDVIHKKDLQLDWLFRWRCAIDIAKGMNFLHTTTPPIIHRDLKSPNILVSSMSPTDDVVAKVADFGLSQALATSTKGRAVDNPIWLPPEVLENEDYTEKADVYAYGVILWEIATREDFFGEIKFSSQIEKKVIAGERPPIPSSVPVSYAYLIQRCWGNNPDERPSFIEILSQLRLAFQAQYPAEVEQAFFERQMEAPPLQIEEEEIVETDVIPSAIKFRTIDEIEEEKELFEQVRF